MNTTTLTALPVCECGHVFREGITLRTDLLEHYSPAHKLPIAYAQPRFEPAMCPKCEKRIETLIFDPTKFKGMLDGGRNL